MLTYPVQDVVGYFFPGGKAYDVVVVVFEEFEV